MARIDRVETSNAALKDDLRAARDRLRAGAAEESKDKSPEKDKTKEKERDRDKEKDREKEKDRDKEREKEKKKGNRMSRLFGAGGKKDKDDLPGDLEVRRRIRTHLTACYFVSLLLMSFSTPMFIFIFCTPLFLLFLMSLFSTL